MQIYSDICYLLTYLLWYTFAEVIVKYKSDLLLRETLCVHLYL